MSTQSPAEAQDPLKRRQGASRRLVVIHNKESDSREVYACKRVDTLALLDVGWAEIIGEDYLQSIQEEFLSNAEKELRLAGCVSAEQRKSVEAAFEEQERVATVKAILHVLQDRDRVAKLVTRCDAWICAAVEGIGVAIDPEYPIGPVAAGTAPVSFCVPLAGLGGSVIRPLRFVGPAETPREGQLCITDLWEDERLLLGMLVQAAFSRLSRVRPLRS